MRVTPSYQALLSVIDLYTLGTAVSLDVVVVLACLSALLYSRRLSFTHFGTWYFVFHVFSITMRGIALYFGAPSVWSDLVGISPLKDDEVCKAIAIADLGCVAMTLGWIYCRKPRPRPVEARSFSRSFAKPVLMVTFLVGLVAGYYVLRLPGAHETELGSWANSSYPTIASTWCGLALMGAIYVYGARKRFVIPMMLYIGIIALQGFSRFRVVMAVLFLIAVYIDRRARKWPRTSHVAALVLIGVMFFPLKGIGRSIQQGVGLSDVWAFTADSMADAFSMRHPDEAFLDEYASYVSLADRSHGPLFGATYLPLAVLPVPRNWWPNKPGLADWAQQIQTSDRPVFTFGMVPTFYGEVYVNFGIVGVILIAFVWAYLSGTWFAYAYETPFFSLRRFFYLVVMSTVIQVYRDGLISLVVFPLVNSAPLVALAVINLREKRQLLFPDVIRSAGVRPSSRVNSYVRVRNTPVARPS